LIIYRYAGKNIYAVCNSPCFKNKKAEFYRRSGKLWPLIIYTDNSIDKLLNFAAKPAILGGNSLDHSISEIILFHRKESGLTRNQLADLAGVGKTVIYDIEKGKESIQFSTLQKVLKALNIKIVFTSPLMEVLDEKS